MLPKMIAVVPLLLLVVSSTAEAREPMDTRATRAVAAAGRAPAPTVVQRPASGEPPPAPTTETAPIADGRSEAPRDVVVDDGPQLDGFSIGARLGYALPMGSIAKDAGLGATDLSRTASGMVPFWGDIGYRVNPHWYVGGYFQLGILGTSGELCHRAAGGNTCSSSGTDIRFGAHIRYTFAPGAKIAPWFGVSSGYEITNVSLTVGPNTEDYAFKGWEFIGLHMGADFRAAPAVTIGPAVMASFGQYGSASWTRAGNSGASDFTNTALHQWVFFGLRGQYDL